MKRLFAILIPLFVTACSLIYDDLSVCGDEHVLHYQLQLRTELTTQLQTELAAETDSLVREALKDWLSPVFTDKAKDIDLHFFSQETDLLSRRIQDVINSNTTSYTINLPKMNYMHLALANMADNDQMYVADDVYSTTMRLGLPDKPVLHSLNTGVFSARLPMAVEDTSQQFNVYLYMVNAAVALVIDTTECDSLASIDGMMNDAACGFAVRDSVFSYASPCSFKLVNVPVKGALRAPQAQPALREEITMDHPLCMATVGMPTPDDAPWTITVTSHMMNNKEANNTITLTDPLRAGTLRVFQLKMTPDGKLEEKTGSEVGIAITVEWKDGGSHEVVL